MHTFDNRFFLSLCDKYFWCLRTLNLLRTTKEYFCSPSPPPLPPPPRRWVGYQGRPNRCPVIIYHPRCGKGRLLIICRLSMSRKLHKSYQGPNRPKCNPQRPECSHTRSWTVELVLCSCSNHLPALGSSRYLPESPTRTIYSSSHTTTIENCCVWPRPITSIPVA